PRRRPISTCYALPIDPATGAICGNRTLCEFLSRGAGCHGPASRDKLPLLTIPSTFALWSASPLAASLPARVVNHKKIAGPRGLRFGKSSDGPSHIFPPVVWPVVCGVGGYASPAVPNCCPIL